MKFNSWLEKKDPETYNEILGTLALATGAAGLIAPKQTGRALKYLARKGVDTASSVVGHVAKTGIDLGADAIRGGAKLAGKGLYHGAKLAGKGLYHGAKSVKGTVEKEYNKSINFKEYVYLVDLEEELNEMSFSSVSKGLKTAIDIPENIVAGLYKAFKVMKATAFIAALIYIGFRFEMIRGLLPWLAPFVDKAGALIASLGGSYLKDCWNKLMSLFPDVGGWLSDNAKDVIKSSNNAYQINKRVDPNYRPYWGPTGKF